MDDRKSFDDVSYWRREFAQHGDIVDPANFPLILIGNKSDLSLQETQVSEDEIQQWCHEYGHPYPFLLTSAKTGEHVETIFKTAVNIWKERQEKLAADSSAASSPTGQNNFHSNDTVDLNNQGSRRKFKLCC